jgi:dTDP-4-dehydrorhamnose reductase
VRAVVIGGSGQIGGWLLRHLIERGHEAVGTYATFPCPGLVALNAADPASAAWVASQRPDIVFYPAGFTWVDGCERDPARARAANCAEPLAIARAAASAGARFVYFSTDYLFDGQSGPYAENAVPRPLNVYGQAKLEAEHALAEALDEAVLIARTCWVYGPERQGKNFAYQVVRALRQGKPLPCPSDQFANPSYGPDVALAAIVLAELGIGGVVHLAGPDWIDRVSFARAIANAFEVDAGLIQPAPTSELTQGAARPLRGGLRSERLGELPKGIRGLAEGLADFRAKLELDPQLANPLADQPAAAS